MIIETEDYRDILKTELAAFDQCEELAKFNKRYNTKTAALITLNSQIVCGNLASFRTSSYAKEKNFHVEFVITDAYSADLQGLVLYVAKVNIRNEPQTSKPCRDCMINIRRCYEEISAIVYRDERLRIVKEAIE